jgi:hypothetical protein
MTAATILQTFADVLALGSDARVELLDGRIVPKAAPVLDHAYSRQRPIRPEHPRRVAGPRGRWPM